MVKGRTTISVDNELLKIAQEKGFNVSALTERAIIEKYHKPDIDEIKELKCAFCGCIGKQEEGDDVLEANREAQRNDDAEHPQKYSEPTKLTWLWPDNKFICNKCLNKITRSLNSVS
jgi:hypothetical protein